MWDLKLALVDYFFQIDLNCLALSSFILNLVDPIFQNGFIAFNWKIFFQFSQNLSFFFAIKFCLAIGFLILIRGGTPRYRYDYLTKLGWLKFLGFVILIFFFSLFFFFLF